MIGKRWTIVAFAACVMASGCASVVVRTEPSASLPSWRSIGYGVSRWEQSAGGAGTLRMYRFPAGAFAFRFEHATSAMSVREWAARFPDAALVMNGVYFHDDQLPSGGFVSKGERIGDRLFDADKSGVIIFSPSVRIIDTAEERVRIEAFAEAAQSFPFFIKEGRAAIAEDSGLSAERSFIGMDRRGDVYLGTVTGATVSLHALMTILLEHPADWTNVINLDGGPSTGFVVRLPEATESRNSMTPVSNVIVVTGETR